jgi:Cu+-exporting ATPase
MTTPVQPIEIVSFPVEGMTCASCVNRITRFLGKVDGVKGANVNLASETATVRFDRVELVDAIPQTALGKAPLVRRQPLAAPSH